MQITRSAIDLLHQKLHIPADYTIYFVHPRLPRWKLSPNRLLSVIVYIYITELLATNGQNMLDVFYHKSQVFYDYEQSIEEILLPDSDADVVCLTHNETSNGTHLKQWNTILQKYPEALIAVDATSSMAGVELDWQSADIWLLLCKNVLAYPLVWQ
jgi:phosphoserine aminotransferase